MNKLTLDGSAIKVLFPENSEARLILSRAVVEETIKMLSKKSIESLSQVVLEEITPLINEHRAVAREEAKKVASGYFGGPTLTKEVQESIKRAVDIKLQIEVNNVIKSTLKNLFDTINFEELAEKYFNDNKDRLLEPFNRTLNNTFVAKLNQLIKNEIG